VDTHNEGEHFQVNYGHNMLLLKNFFLVPPIVRNFNSIVIELNQSLLKAEVTNQLPRPGLG
jgi:hypothetical protein